jgi:hypothetical protein
MAEGQQWQPGMALPATQAFQGGGAEHPFDALPIPALVHMPESTLPTAVLATHHDPTALVATAWVDPGAAAETAQTMVVPASVSAPVWATPPPAALSNTIAAVLAAPVGEARGAAHSQNSTKGPVKPRTPFIYFSRATRETTRAAADGLLQGTELLKVQSAAWKELDAAGRAPYQAQAAADVQRYEEECEAARTGRPVAARSDGMVTSPPKQRRRRSSQGVPRWSEGEEEMLRASIAELEGGESGPLLQGQKLKWETCAERLGTGRTAEGVEQHWQIMRANSTA